MRILAEYEVEFEDNGGKHPYRFRKPGVRVWPVAAHRGMQHQLDDRIVDSACRHFELPKEEVWRRLRRQK